MKKEYDLKNLKVKRRGILATLQNEESASNKVRITISLDKDVINYFKEAASHPGAFPYQTQINQALRKIMRKRDEKKNPEDIEDLKSALLNDTSFIRKLAKKLHHKQA